ncbi:LOW QUALITY PROTEIN: opioid growth factor receptor [Tupaia chinensis]|uniref:LOW QUALITY PROTEIN: opioid growth factor receptor n=1 Tax=Tupaia chinensis TaxID=246437 RepID=UPI000FFCA305|nr:LOW QUALITY PROTEIN: opioid growth factor receptor [Tupaia chinensis]
MDDPDCDSTWEEDEEDEHQEDGEAAGAGHAGDADADAGDEDAVAEEEEPRAARPRAPQSRVTGPRNWRALQDMRRYRHHYPDLVDLDCNGDMPNLSFYRNEIRFLPDGCFIEDILQNWRGNYELLEDNHSYIQWLFPLREPGVNWHAKPLTLREVEAFRSSEEVRERLVRAYELMLGFYGIELEDRATGAVRRADNYQKRFQNLNWRSHNNLRLTRILKALGELGLPHYQAPLVRFFLEETLLRGQLAGVRQSALDYFVFAVRCRRQRRELLHFAWEHFRPRCRFVWGPHDKLRRFGAGAAPHQPAGPKQAMGEETSEDRLREARPQGRTSRPGQCCHGKDEGGKDEGGKDEGEDGDAEERCRGDDEDGDDEDGDDEDGESGGSPLPSRKLPGMGTLERRQGDEAGALGEDEGEPPSPKESKKRKLEAGRREQASGEPGPQSTFDVEKIALNLQGCALSQGSQALREGEQPCPLPPRTRVTDELRKRRRVDEGVGDGAGGVASGHAQAPAPTQPPAPAGSPEAGEDEGRIEDPGRIEAPGGQAEPEQGDAQSLAAGPSPAGPAAEGAEAAEPAEPAEPAGVGPPANPRKP